MTTKTNIADPEWINSIVREVIARLKKIENVDSSITKPASRQNKPDHASETSTLKLDDAVITLETLRNRLSNVKQIVVNPKAVVTPAVKDELREHQITIVKSGDSQPQKNRTIHIARLAGTYFPVDWLKPIGDVEICSAPDYQAIGNELEKKLKGNEKAICFSAKPFLAAAMLNRTSTLNAAYAKSERDVVEIKATMRGNVLVLESSLDRQLQQKLVSQFLK